jgi:recombination protein RecA
MMAADINIQRYPWASVQTTVATGGLARGRIHLLYGNRSSGKSLLAMQTVGLLQRQYGLTAAIIDSEGTTDPFFIEKFGVDSKKLLVSHDKSFLKAGEAAVDFLKAGVDILIVDSISTLIPEQFLDGDEIKNADGQKQMGARAKSVGVLMNTIHYANDCDAIIIVISQAKMVMGAKVPSIMADGGKAMEHAASQIFKVTASPAESQQIKGDYIIGDRILQKPIGREVSLLVEKNKLGPASQAIKYNMYYAGMDIGIDTYEEVVTLGTEMGIFDKSGTWLSYNGQKWQGSKQVATAMRAEPDLYAEIQKKVYDSVGMKL